MKDHFDTIGAVCVFTGSNMGARPSYEAAAKALGTLLAARGIRLVYGGAHLGLMGAVADACLNAKGSVTGVIPKALVELEIAHDGLTQLHVVDSMHERKALMADLSQGFIMLPGGMGTLEEFFEVWTWSQLGYHQKPVGILNIDGYFDGMIGFLRDMAEERFIREAHLDTLIVETDPAMLLERFGRYKPLSVKKWIARDET